MGPPGPNREGPYFLTFMHDHGSIGSADACLESDGVQSMWRWGFRFSCKEPCAGSDDCVAIEYNGMQQLCELHDAVPTHNATGSRRSGCDPRQTKCLRRPGCVLGPTATG